MNWNSWIRQFHRWVSVAFTRTVIANFVVMGMNGGQQPPALCRPRHASADIQVDRQPLAGPEGGTQPGAVLIDAGYHQIDATQRPLRSNGVERPLHRLDHHLRLERHQPASQGDGLVLSDVCLGR